jgi:Dihydroprymidine dehydrogenase domain II, 4Fe-4S cluster
VDEPRYSVRVADNAYWREQIKCQCACPVHTDARGYVRAIAAGDYEQAYLIARGPNPLASLCGRICGAPCEGACRRGTIDQPISIRALKRFVCEKFGSDARRDAGRELFPYLKNKTETRQCDDIEELSHLLEFLANASFPKPTGERIAIIGSGPAGLAAGHDLALMEGKFDADTWPNSGIGRVNPDGSRGSCAACHGAGTPEADNVWPARAGCCSPKNAGKVSPLAIDIPATTTLVRTIIH